VFLDPGDNHTNGFLNVINVGKHAAPLSSFTPAEDALSRLQVDQMTATQSRPTLFLSFSLALYLLTHLPPLPHPPRPLPPIRLTLSCSFPPPLPSCSRSPIHLILSDFSILFLQATNAAGLATEAASDGVRMLCVEPGGQDSCPFKFSRDTVCL
jgi:hypothetical protein